jgi:hypothetical protein
MSNDSFNLLLALFSAGVALCLLGGARLLLAQCRPWVRSASVLAAAAISAAGPIALEQSIAAPLAAGVVVGAVLLLKAAGSQLLSRAMAVAVAFAARPAVRAAVLGLGGLGLAVGAVVTWDVAEEAATDRDMEFLAELNAHPPTREPAGSVVGVTDRGRRVTIKEAAELRPAEVVGKTEARLLRDLKFDSRLIRRAAPSDQCNCHGWVFTGGRFWVAGDDVSSILEDNGYQPVSQPRPGDLAIYRDAGLISHTAVVRAVGEDMLVLVEGKWGWMGVYLHGVADSCYGTNYTYYRSSREGHLLAGIDGRSTVPPAGDANAADVTSVCGE